MVVILSAAVIHSDGTAFVNVNEASGDYQQ